MTGAVCAAVVANCFAHGDGRRGSWARVLPLHAELMERNGGTLTCETSRKGTIFRLALAAVTSIRVAKGR